jgi:hypothetical protein
MSRTAIRTLCLRNSGKTRIEIPTVSAQFASSRNTAALICVELADAFASQLAGGAASGWSITKGTMNPANCISNKTPVTRPISFSFPIDVSRKLTSFTERPLKSSGAADSVLRTQVNRPSGGTYVLLGSGGYGAMMNKLDNYDIDGGKILKGAVAGAAGGFVASFVMDQFQAAWSAVAKKM